METPLRKLRTERGLTITQVANAVNCDYGNLSRIERGKQVPSIALAERLSNFFDKKVTEMEILYPHKYQGLGTTNDNGAAA